MSRTRAQQLVNREKEREEEMARKRRPEQTLRRLFKLKRTKTRSRPLPFVLEPGPGPRLPDLRTVSDDINNVIAFAKSQPVLPLPIQRAVQQIHDRPTALVEVLSWLATFSQLPRAIHLATWFLRPEGPEFKGYLWGIVSRKENAFYRRYGYSMYEDSLYRRSA